MKDAHSKSLLTAFKEIRIKSFPSALIDAITYNKGFNIFVFVIMVAIFVCLFGYVMVKYIEPWMMR